MIITGHNRSMCTQLGAANKYDLAHLQRPDIWELVQQAQFYFVGGYHLTVCPDAIMALGREAAEKNKTLVFSLSAPFICQFFKEPLDATAPYWDVVIGNETEAQAYADAHDWNTKDLMQIAQKLATLEKKNTSRQRVAIVTQGSGDTIVAFGNSEIKQYFIHKIEQDKIVDTTGAGDAFAAGVVAGLVLKEDWNTCIDRGLWLAKLCIQQEGPV